MLVLGLGNPGQRYEKTRHNVGFDTVEKIAAQEGVCLRKRCFRPYRVATLASGPIVEPLTYMNNSGDILKYFSSEVASGLIVIVDQMDLPIGRIRIKRGGGSAGHNGLKSIISNLNEDFIRVYIGIGRPEEGVSVVDHVLSRFSDEDRVLVESAEDKAKDAVLRLLGGESLSRVIQDANTSRA